MFLDLRWLLLQSYLQFPAWTSRLIYLLSCTHFLWAVSVSGDGCNFHHLYALSLILIVSAMSRLNHLGYLNPFGVIFLSWMQQSGFAMNLRLWGVAELMTLLPSHFLSWIREMVIISVILLTGSTRSLVSLCLLVMNCHSTLLQTVGSAKAAPLPSYNSFWVSTRWGHPP